MDHREQFPTCAHALRFVSCGDTNCPLHGEYEAKWSGRGASLERDQDFRRLVLDRMRGVQLSEERPSLPPSSEPFVRSRIDHWLRNRNLVMHHAGMNKSMGYAGTIEAIMALMDDLAEYEAEGAAVRSVDSLRPPPLPWAERVPTNPKAHRLTPEYLAQALKVIGSDNDAIATDLELHIGALEAELAELRGADSVAAPEETKRTTPGRTVTCAIIQRERTSAGRVSTLTVSAKCRSTTFWKRGLYGRCVTCMVSELARLDAEVERLRGLSAARGGAPVSDRCPTCGASVELICARCGKPQSGCDHDANSSYRVVGDSDLCFECKQLPDGPASSRNPALTICRNCWAGRLPAALSSDFLDQIRAILARGDSLTHHEASALLSAHETLVAAYHQTEERPE